MNIIFSLFLGAALLTAPPASADPVNGENQQDTEDFSDDRNMPVETGDMDRPPVNDPGEHQQPSEPNQMPEPDLGGPE